MSSAFDKASRREIAFRIRVAAAQLARDRPHEVSVSNGEEGRYRRSLEDKDDPLNGTASYSANFTKGLPHLPNGMVANPRDYIDFVRAIDSGRESDIQQVALGPLSLVTKGSVIWRSRIARKQARPVGVRGWESMAAGLAFSIEGPDAQSVSIPPAPRLESCELVAEMAELYLMSLLRDLPFALWKSDDGCVHPKLQDAIDDLNHLKWFSKKDTCSLSDYERGRKRGTVKFQNVFRGNSPGCKRGPYLSQFLILGSTQLGEANLDDKLNGRVRFGAFTTIQKVRIVEHGVDYMTDFNTFLDVQDGADLRGLEKYEEGERFIATPRDLCTYVHYDALYQAYLTACIFLLEDRVPFDPGLPFQLNDLDDKQQAFAHFGGPHILTLVTEVATRALKAVRYQKFNIHRRCRPEAVGGLIDAHIRSSGKDFPEAARLAEDLAPILSKVEAYNHVQNTEQRTCVCSRSDARSSRCGKKANGSASATSSSHRRESKRSPCKSYLLPMAYPEGSPMHPAYGAGHATVAAACVTILKAWFDTNHELDEAFEPSADGSCLHKVNVGRRLTVGGELNKLAANISIGRNWAGVHYYSDYSESARLGEKIAIGILEEQKLLFGENFYMSLEKMDGTVLRI